MKRILLIAFAFAALCATAQETTEQPVKKEKKKIELPNGDGFYNKDSTWKFGGFAGVTLTQVALYQWAPGGSNNFAFLITGNAYANYKKDKYIWDNSLDLKWGMVANGLIRKSSLAKQNLQKNIDIVALKSNFGYEVSKSLYVAAKLGFESQLTRSYDYSLTDTVDGRYRKFTVSKFAAPAILTIAPGLTWKPKDYFTLFFSPVGGKMTFVTPDHNMRDTTTTTINSKVAFTDNYYNDVDETRFGLKAGKWFMGELGAELDLLFQKEIVKNVSWKSHLNVFVTYMNKAYNTALPSYNETLDSVETVFISENTKFIPVVRWDNDIVLKVNKWLSATLSTRFVYQYNALVPIDKRNNKDGKKGADGISDRDKLGTPITGFNKLQIFEQFGVGLAFKF